MNPTTPDIQAELNRRFENAQKDVQAPDVGEVGSSEWRMGAIKKQAAIQTMLLDKRLPELDRQMLTSMYEHTRMMLDEMDRQHRRNWEAGFRREELELLTQYREVTLQYSEASKQMAESQAAAAKQTSENAAIQSKSLIRATWILAGATIVLAVATVLLIFVTAGAGS